ncbi:hypothetical protein DSO57_1028910 [Entomophthora muscae]|uniref:Uncharacterized protein n=1 Tax=Entomophthora muscae TaxID=34485 RepID=A0ACC2SR54_9FUNG|nr:hypothetical protein DSO57_1028910 [Entomophthora muscae]
MCDSVYQGSFKNNLRVDVFYKIWKPKETKVNVVFCHGHSEHVSRYSDIFTRFSENGIKVLAFDQVGYGETGMKMNDLGGARGAEQLLLDMTKAIDVIHKPGIPLFLMGHSFGGLGVLNYLSRGEKKELVHGGVTSDWNDISRNRSTQEKLKSDPLVTFNSTLIQLSDLLLGCQRLIFDGYKSICVSNLLLAHGTDDAIISHDAAVHVAEKLKTNGRIPNFEMKTLPGAYHDLMFEPDGDELVSYFINWIITNASSAAATNQNSPPLPGKR